MSSERRPLSPTRLTMVCHLLGKINSHFDGETLSSVRKADQIIREHGLSWHDVVHAPLDGNAKSQRAKKPRGNPAEPTSGKCSNGPNAHQFDDTLQWRDACEQILASGCSPWKRELCSNLLDTWQAPLTQKQIACLERIYMLRAGYDRRCA